MIPMYVLEMKKNLKDKGLIFWTLLLPIAFIVVFASIFGSDTTDQELTLHYVDTDQSDESAELLQEISTLENVELVKEESYANSVEQIQSGQMNVLFHLPEGFSNDGSAHLYYEQVREEVAAPMIAMLENLRYGLQAEEQYTLAQEEWEDAAMVAEFFTPPFDISYEAQDSGGEVDAITHLIPGYAVMFTFFIMISMVTSFIKDQRSGMLSRLAATPLAPLQYLGGKWIAFITIVFLQVVILLLFGYFVYDITLGNVPAITAVSLLLALTATGLGLGLSLVVRTENMGIALTQVIALGGAIVAGLWMPLEFMPSFIQTISVGLPQYWAHQAFLDVMSRGATIVDIWPSLAMLLGFSMLGAFIAWLSYGRYVKHAN